jgi:FixJ family two-component response regulator
MILIFQPRAQIAGVAAIRAAAVARARLNHAEPRDSDVSETRIVAVIDDDDSIRSAIDDLVCSLGLVAHTYASAEDFLASPDLDASSCVICDLQMPGMGGQDLQRRMIEEGRRVPMIFITAYPEPRMRDSILNNGALAFLEKPFDGGKLVSLIRHVVAPH